MFPPKPLLGKGGSKCLVPPEQEGQIYDASLVVFFELKL
jgi:hypothetical protein